MTDPADDLTRFDACLPFTLAQECPLPDDWGNRKNFSNDPHDPGGATMCGITQREYDAWRKAQELPVRTVKLITEAEGQDIYYSSYWLPECPLLPVGLDLCFFDAAVNEGTHEAIKILQVALGVPNDGTWGPQTATAVKGIFNVAATINAFTARREAVYRLSANFQYFGADWLRRAREIGAAALKMTTPAQA
jgi:lysozyme family protein